MGAALTIFSCVALWGCGPAATQADVGLVREKLGTNGPFTITTTTPIVIPATQKPHGFDGPTVAAMSYQDAHNYSDPDLMSEWSAIRYVRDALKKLKHLPTLSLPVITSSTLDTGVVLTLLSQATPDIAQTANLLASNGTDAYNAT